MASDRIIYQNWIVELGFDPRTRPGPGRGSTADCPPGRAEMIEEAVGAALKRLTEDERELVARFHLMGQSYAEIAAQSGRAQYKLEALHARALRKLRRALAPSVRQWYPEIPAEQPDCPLCRCPRRVEIDRVIKERDRTATWRPVIRTLREEFGIVVTTPQILIGHEKYH